MTATASLPMYDLPGMRAANAALWSALVTELRRHGLTDIPANLSLDDGPAPGRNVADILFTQTCGYPLQTIHRDQLRLLGTPSYDAPGCGAMTHRSFIIVREGDPAQAPDDLRGRHFALNARHSNSGMNLPRHLFAPLARDGRFFRDVVETGSHAASLAAVQQGAADTAAIDCVSWAFAGDHRPDLAAGLRILAQTVSSPALPFVTGVNTAPALANALQRALLTIGSSPAYRDVRKALRIKEIGTVPIEDYAALLQLEDEAIRAGYPTLA
jgi:ABC-type phosphate/phosphonate transport system substrate-binding protein